MIKKIVLFSLIVSGVFWAFFAYAAPTSTYVQNLFITALKSSPTSSLVIGADGLVSTSTVGGSSDSGTPNYFPIANASGTGYVDSMFNQAADANSFGQSDLFIPSSQSLRFGGNNVISGVTLGDFSSVNSIWATTYGSEQPLILYNYPNNQKARFDLTNIPNSTNNTYSFPATGGTFALHGENISGFNNDSGYVNSSTGLSYFAPSTTVSSMWTATSTGIYYNGDISIGTSTIIAPITIESDNIGGNPSSTSGLYLVNNTDAASGTQQVSPSVILSGNGWGTTSSTSQNITWQIVNQPVQSTVPSSNILFQSSQNGAPYVTRYTFGSGGTMTGSGGSFTNLITLVRASVAAVSTDGIIDTNNTAATAGVPVQFSPRIRLTGAAWDTASSSSKSENWKIETIPVSGSPVTSNLNFGHDTNGGGYTNLVSFASGGNVGIGTTAPSTTLQVATTVSSTIRVGMSGNVNNSGCFELYDHVNSTTLMYLYPSSGALVVTSTKPTFCQ